MGTHLILPALLLQLGGSGRPSGQIGGGAGGVLSEMWGWANRNPTEALLYLAVLGIFIWAVWRFGRG